MAQVDSSQSLSETSKFNGAGNYIVWKFCVKQLSEKKDLWELVEAPPSSNTVSGSTVNPVAGEASGASSNIVGDSSQTARSVSSSNESLATLSRCKKKALALICLSVRDEVIPVISAMIDPNIYWKLLESLYGSWSVSQKLLLRQKLSLLRLHEESLVSHFLTKIQDVAN